MSRRLVAIGRKKPEFPTLDVRVSNKEPEWQPRLAPWLESPDLDLMRKQRIEDQLAKDD